MAGSVNFDLLRQRLEQLEKASAELTKVGTEVVKKSPQLTKIVNSAIESFSEDDTDEGVSLEYAPQPPVQPAAAEPIVNPIETAAPMAVQPAKKPAAPAAKPRVRMNRQELRRAVILSEILAPPLSRRK